MEKVRIERLKANETQRQIVEAHYRKAHQVKAEGGRVAYCTNVDVNALIAMGYLPVYPESHAAFCGARGASDELCGIAGACGFSPDLCSYFRTDVGNMRSRGTKSPVMGLPPPDLIATTTFCNTHMKWWEEISRFYDVPLLVLDTPYLHDGLTAEDTQNICSYFRRQLEEFIMQLQYLTGQKFPWDRYQEAVFNASTAAKLYLKFITSGCNHPSPITAFDTFVHVAPMMLYRGFPEAVHYYEMVNAEVEERIQRRFSPIGKEVYRLYWDNIPIWFRLSHLGKKFASFGAAVVAAIYVWGLVDGNAYLDPENPLDTTAWSTIHIYANRGTRYRIDRLCQLLEQYQVDGMVIQTSRTCKPYIMDQLVITREAAKRAGVPTVRLDGDMVDTQLFDQQACDSLLDTFMEMLIKRKSERA